MAKQQHPKESKFKQKFEYWTVVLTTNQSAATTHWNLGTGSATNITINTVTAKQSMVHHVNHILQQYSVEGWRLKNTLYIEDEVMLIFERFTEDYSIYSSEIQRYIDSE